MIPKLRQAELVLDRIEKEARLDAAAGSASGVVERLIPTGSARDFLHGVWIGHPLHPILTDVVIGSWTSASILDLIGGRRSAGAAQTLVGIGCLSALPTALSGAVDWSRTDTVDQRVGVVHAVSNSVALALYTMSWLERRNGRRTAGIVLGMGGAAAATVGGFLGGHLVFRRAIGPNRDAATKPPSEWSDATSPTDNGKDAHVVVFDGEKILVAEDLGAGIAARCTHEGGPLDEGESVGAGVNRCVVCPWHGSTFRLDDGSVVHGPATSPQPAYDVRVTDGHSQVRARRRDIDLSSEPDESTSTVR